MDTFGSWLQHALGTSGEDIDHPRAELDLSDRYTDHSGIAGDQVLDQSPDLSPEQFHRGESSGHSGTSGVQVGREGDGEGGAGGAVPPGSKAKLHYYLKISSTWERPNRFVDRSLPFFVPPASSR